MLSQSINNFPVTMEKIKDRVSQIDPVAYASTRNYKNGNITKLSPYISRGVISTRFVFDRILNLDLSWNKIEKLVQELAWRDYWQQVWKSRGNDINKDLKRKQENVEHFQMPLSIIKASTGSKHLTRRSGNYMTQAICTITCGCM